MGQVYVPFFRIKCTRQNERKITKLITLVWERILLIKYYEYIIIIT